MNKLKDKVAIVTGASKGIGASIATYFAAEGAKVVVNYASSKEGAEKVVKIITANGGYRLSTCFQSIHFPIAYLSSVPSTSLTDGLGCARVVVSTNTKPS